LKLDHKQETIRLYLLGQASPEDSSWLEEELLADGDLYQELRVVEDELIDQYLRNDLPADDHQSFETHFLQAPERRKKLRFGRALHKYVDLVGTSESLEDTAAEGVADNKPGVAKPPPTRGVLSFLPFSNPLVSYSLAAGMLLVVVGASWIAFKTWRQQTSQQPGNVYVVTLTPGLTRDSGELKRLAIPPGTDTVQLRLVLKSDESQSYRAELLTSDRASVLAIDDLKSQVQDGERFIILSLPTRILKRDDYQVRVSGLQAGGSYEETGRYQFRVVQ
jgi:hypothetical protein